MPNQTLLDLALIVVLTAASVRDLMVRRIPNKLLLAGLAGAVLLHLFSAVPLTVLSQCLGGMATGLLLFLPLYLLRGMAAGDVKLMAVVGAYVGPTAACYVALTAFCVGGVMALAIIVAKGRIRKTFANIRKLLRPLIWRAAGAPLVPAAVRIKSVGNMPYGLAIALGGFTVLYLRHM